MLVLYSTVSRLAYVINERFYGGSHYVWCAPARTDAMLPPNAPTSDPWQIYERYLAAADGDDRHEPIIDANRAGIIRGATAREAQKQISADDRETIEQIVKLARPADFRPLFMVIPYEGVRPIARPVPIDARASPTSEEFIIESLPRTRFDIWEWPNGNGPNDDPGNLSPAKEPPARGDDRNDLSRRARTDTR